MPATLAPALAVALAADSIAVVLLSVALACFFAGHLIRRRKRLRPSWLAARDGRVGLSDKGREKIAQRGFDVEQIEASIAQTFELDEQGEIVLTEPVASRL